MSDLGLPSANELAAGNRNSALGESSINQDAALRTQIRLSRHSSAAEHSLN